MYYESNYLSHHGVKGMKWGVRRYQNDDGSLNDKGKKKAHKKYQKEMIAYQKQSMRNRQQLNLKAYNKTADEYNNGKIADFNKKHNVNSKDYLQKYKKQFEQDYRRNYDKMMLSELENNRHYKKAQKICEKYSMTKFDDMAKKNEAYVRDLKKVMDSGRTSWDLDMKKYLPDE